jgi:hypothetical protein
MRNENNNSSQVAHQALRLASKIANKFEDKYFDVQVVDDTDVDYDGTVLPLNDMAQGDTDQTRDGDSISMKSLEIRATVTNNAAVTAGVRLVVVRDKQNTLANPGDYLAYGSDPVALNTPFAWDNRHRFTVLYDEVINADGTLFDKHSIVHFIPLKGLKTQYDGGSTDATTNALKLIYISDVDSTGMTFPTLRLVSRLIYNDC